MIRRIFVLFVLLLSACAPGEKETEQPRQTLVAYFDALRQSDYDTVINLYGGSYEGMSDQNPSLDPNDHLALWKNTCEINGNQCMLLVRAMKFKKESRDIYSFVVEFNTPDGTLFALGPCCGGSATDFPPVTQFEYRVKKLKDGKFVVLDLPVYVP